MDLFALDFVFKFTSLYSLFTTGELIARQCKTTLTFFPRHHSHHPGLVLFAVPTVQSLRGPSGWVNGSVSSPSPDLRTILGHRLRQPESSRGHYVLPNALHPPGPLPAPAQHALPHALPYRPGLLRVPNLPGSVKPDPIGPAHRLVQDSKWVLLSGEVGAVWHPVGSDGEAEPSGWSSLHPGSGEPEGSAVEVAVANGGSVGVRAGCGPRDQTGTTVQATV